MARPEAAIDLGEHGEHSIDNVRVWRSPEPGKLIAFIRKEAGEHKEVVAAVVALGVIATGVYDLKYRRKRPSANKR